MAYTDRTELETAFGKENIKTWADLENNGVEADIEARIEWAIREADDKINIELAYRYPVPIVAPPTFIKSIATKLAAVKLYESRGVQEMDQVTNQSIHRLQWHQKNAETSLARIRLGVLNIQGSQLQTAPGVVKDTATISGPYPPRFVDPFMLW